jgi:regulator of sirC expression with transglutaminase-like and TPR domain
VLERRTGTCAGLAQAYLVLTERLGLPVVAVATPNHIFVRWLDGSKYVNVELLEAGKQVSDEEYRQRSRISEADPSNPVFLRNLGPMELLARVYNNLGVIRSRAGDLEGGFKDYGKAIHLDPRFPAPYYNRGLDHLNAGRASDALPDLDTALMLYPADARALNNRGLARMRLGRWVAAIEDFEKGMALDPALPACRKNLDIARLLLRGSKRSTDSAHQESSPEAEGGEPAGARP